MASSAWNLLVMVVLCLKAAAGQDTNFFFNYFNAIDPNLQYSGDTLVTADGQLNLTKYVANSIGHTVYLPAIRLLDLSTSTKASFSTNFSFRIQPGQHDTTGEGLSFVLLGSNTNISNGAGGAFLGVYDEAGAQVTKTVAVEFDTFRNDKVGSVQIDDINANHVGLDLDVIRSRVQVDAGTTGIFLASGSTITSWIDYTASTSTIEVRISLESAGRPANPLLSYCVDLSTVFSGSEDVWIGFSAATGEYCFEYHSICNWGFSSWGLPPSYPPLTPPPPPASPPPPVWHGGPAPPPATPPPTYGSPPPPPPWHGGPVPPPATPPPPPPWHGGPAPPPATPPSPSPWHGGPAPPPATPPPYTPRHGGPIPPPVSPPSSGSPIPPPWHGGSPPPPVPKTPPPWHGGPVLPPSPTSDIYYHPGPPPGTNPVKWAVPTGVGCALLVGLGLLLCWKRPHVRPTPPPPPPPPPPGPEDCPPDQPPAGYGGYGPPHGPPHGPYHRPTEELEELIIIGD